MSKAIIKPRWKTWENKCIQKSVEQKIQLKIMALALGRTLTSVSKKIRKLGLRGATSRRGRLKGDKGDIPLGERTSFELNKMSLILQKCAPLKASQEGQLALKRGYWTASTQSIKNPSRGQSLGYIKEEKTSFSFLPTLDYILKQDHIPQKEKRKTNFGDPYYISFAHMEKWAASEGFLHVERNLYQRGISYWKEGRYFSKAQLLIYVNQIRFEKKLQPLAVYEDEVEVIC
ncbi:MAG: hypothetical protein JSR85_05085 [Proteobacteria bacterium]|nr:hypothetical protein [Pseudomonadota bacterium]